MAALTCPHCGKEDMSHGVCGKCKKHCGCSFDPHGKNDWCAYHYMQATKKEEKAHMCGCGFAHKQSERCGPW